MLNSDLTYSSTTAVPVSLDLGWTIENSNSGTISECQGIQQSSIANARSLYNITCLNCGCKFKSYDAKQDLCDNCMQEFAVDCLIDLD